MFYVTLEQFREDIHEIVATHPDFTYPLDPNGDDADLWLGIGADEEHYATDSGGCRYSLRGSDKTLRVGTHDGTSFFPCNIRPPWTTRYILYDREGHAGTMSTTVRPPKCLFHSGEQSTPILTP